MKNMGKIPPLHLKKIWYCIDMNKIRLHNVNENTFLYPNETGHFYVHHVGGLIVWDADEIWESSETYTFVPAYVEHCDGKYDTNGDEIYIGDLIVFEVSQLRSQHFVWEKALNFKR